MRYRIGSDGLQVAETSTDVVLATVWLTLFIGIAFVVFGIRGRQYWLQFWGAVTVLSCTMYFMRDLLGLGQMVG